VDQVTKKKQEPTLFSAGKARWLLQNVQKLDENQRALLLAIAELDKGTGRTLTDEERAALDRLTAETHGFDPVEIQAAVQKMVKGKAKRKPVKGWPASVVRKLKRSKK